MVPPTPPARLALRYVSPTKNDSSLRPRRPISIGFDINYRELLSCAFAVHAIALSSPFTSNFELTTCPRSRGRISWHRVTLVTDHRPFAQLLGSDVEASFSAIHVAGADNRIADGALLLIAVVLCVCFEELTRGWPDRANRGHLQPERLGCYLRIHSVASHTHQHGTPGISSWNSTGMIEYSLPARSKQFLTSFDSVQHGYGSSNSRSLYRRNTPRNRPFFFGHRQSISPVAIHKSAWS
ncbi:hypothetical protein GQ600_26614 [Phytophthora cactorum]|nr:hypothetical protein GQ600_26614 [Phytophthora cactorum]